MLFHCWSVFPTKYNFKTEFFIVLAVHKFAYCLSCLKFHQFEIAFCCFCRSCKLAFNGKTLLADHFNRFLGMNGSRNLPLLNFPPIGRDKKRRRRCPILGNCSAAQFTFWNTKPQGLTLLNISTSV